MENLPLFDLAESERRKQAGQDCAASANPTNLELAREIAIELARSNPKRTTNADLVGDELFKRHGIESLGNSAGSLFKGGAWRFTGERIRSARKKNHGREIKVWELNSEKSQ
jgi:hypothetical protein